MNITLERQQRAKILPIRLNGNTVAGLFKKYEEIGFLYPEKKALLMPHFQEICKNWDTLLNSEEELLWMMTTDKQQIKNDFASITAWKQSNYCFFAQHLVSTGNPLMSLKVLLAAQDKAQFHHDESDIRCCQNWFRPNNRYAYRVFASIYDKLGAEKSSLLLFHYLHLSFTDVQTPVQTNLVAEEVTNRDAELITFVNGQYGNVFVRGEEIDQEDIQLDNMDAIYRKYNLSRRRKILKIRDTNTNKIIACVIANRGPLGLNFSFLENRSYYIIDKNIAEEQRPEIVATMNAAIKSFYFNFKLQVIPIVTDGITSNVLLAQKAVFQRKYMQSIWMREGFSEWYDHIYSFLQRIEGRMGN